MLTEERHSVILETVMRQRSVKLGELCRILGSSESTVRRDLNVLDKRGMLKKVHGGAIASEDSFSLYEHDVSKKSTLNTEEKHKIAEYAASLIEDGDFVFIDAGTTTEKMIDYIRSKNVTFVTTAFMNAKKLAQHGFKVYIPGGEIKAATEAIVGAECVTSLRNYNFTKAFVGANGISLSGGFSTPDKNEAAVKSTVIEKSKKTYILADSSKFDSVSAVTFAALSRAEIITGSPADNKYYSECTIKEVF